MNYHIIDLRTRHLECFEDAYNNIDASTRGKVTLAGAIVRAAVGAGWFANVMLDQVNDLPVSETLRLAELIIEKYTELIAPPNPN